MHLKIYRNCLHYQIWRVFYGIDNAMDGDMLIPHCYRHKEKQKQCSTCVPKITLPEH